jgi:hypothetical protein
MENLTILYIGRHLEILNTVVRVINKNDNWTAVGAMNIEEVKSLCEENHYEIILLGSGISEQNECILRCFFEKNSPDSIIVQHYGGGSGLLNSEIICAAYDYKKKRVL